MIFILSLLFLIQSIAGVPIPRVITRWHTAQAVTTTETLTTSTTTVWLPPVEVYISGSSTTTFTVTTGTWATSAVTYTSYAAGQQEEVDPTLTDNAQTSSTYAAETTPTSTYVPETTTSAATEATSSDAATEAATSDAAATTSSVDYTPSTSSTDNEQTSTLSTAAPTTSSLVSSSSKTSSSSTSNTQTSSSSDSSSSNVLSVGSENGYKYSQSSVKLTRPDVIVYSPYTNDGSCKDYDDVETDLKFLQNVGFSKIRVYGVDCNVISAVLPIASNLGLTVNQGFWISSSGVDSIDDAVTDLISYGEDNGWSVFDYITIGNEAIIEGYATVSELISKISSVKSKLKKAGYTGKVTTSEPPASFIAYPELCTESEIDFVGINSHSYFNTNLYANEAGAYVVAQQKEVAALCSKTAVITETGYPAKGIQNGNNVPSLENQYAAIKSLMEATDGDCTILSTYYDYWKDAGSYGIEQSFGVVGFF